MAGLSKVKVCDPGGTSGSRVNTMRSFPGSVAIIGFTGEVKFITRVGGFVLFTWAVKWTASIADEQPPRAFVEIYRTRPESAACSAGERTQRDQAAPVFQQEVGRKIESLSLHPRPGFSGGEFAVHAVVIQPPDVRPSVRALTEPRG